MTESGRLPGKRDPRLGKLVRRLRVAIGLTQPQLADRVGVTLFEICRWETARMQPQARVLQKLAKALGVSPARLVAVYKPASPGRRVPLKRPAGPETLGWRIHRVRLAAGVTRAELARRLRINWVQVNRWSDVRRTDMWVAMLIAIARALGCRPADLLPGTRFAPRFARSGRSAKPGALPNGIGPALRHARLRRGLSVATLAGRSILTGGAVRHMESGRIRWPMLSTLTRIAKALDCRIEVLLPPA